MKLCDHFGWMYRGLRNQMWAHEDGGTFGGGDCKDDKGLHHLRESWRKVCFNAWLNSDSRRDSQISRNVGVAYTAKLSRRLHTIAMWADAHQLAVLSGGMTTEATFRGRTNDAANPVASWCHDCRRDVIPSVQHVLWECPAYQDLRHLSQPSCPLAARVGWTNTLGGTCGRLDGVKLLIGQMARIREAECKARMARVKMDGGNVDSRGCSDGHERSGGRGCLDGHAIHDGHAP